MPDIVNNVRTRFMTEEEAKYKAEISDINKGISVLNAEMRKCTAEFADNADSVEALSAKGDILERKLLSQKEKVEALKKAVQESVDAHGEASAQTMNWKTQLANAETAVFNTERAIRQNNEALEKAKDAAEESGGAFRLFSGEAKGLGDMLDGLSSKLGIRLPGSAKEALNGLGSVNGTMVAVAGATGALATGIVKAEEKLKDLTDTAAADTDALNTLSTNTGIAYETLEKWSYAADLIDVPLETMTGSMAKMIKNMDSAREGSGAAAEAWEKLGISVTDSNGNLRDAETVFYETIDALGKVENATERDADAMAIYGKSAQDLNSLIVQGREKLEEYGKEAENTGYILEEWQIKNLQDYQDALDRANLSSEALGKQMGSVMAPGLQELTEGWQHLKYEGVDLLLDSGIIDFFSDLASGAGKVLGFIGNMFDALNMMLHPLKTIKELLGYTDETLEEHADRLEDATKEAENDTEAMEGLSSTQKTLAASTEAATAALVAQAHQLKYNREDTATLSQQVNQLILDMDNLGISAYGSYEQVKLALGADAASLLRTEAFYEARNRAAIGTGGYVTEWSFNASGNSNFVGGLTSVSENGGEDVILPRGTRILTAQESRENRKGGNTYVINAQIDRIETFEAMMRWFEMRRVEGRMG